MSEHITDKLVKALAKPAKGNRIIYDDDVAGFGEVAQQVVLHENSFALFLPGDGLTGMKPVGRQCQPSSEWK